MIENFQSTDKASQNNRHLRPLHAVGF